MSRPSFRPEQPFEFERRAARQRTPSPRERFPSLLTEDLFPFQREGVHLVMSGTFAGGGRALIQEGDLKAKVELGPVVFTVLANLIMAAKRAEGRKPFSAAGFISATHLGRELERRSFKGEQVYAVKDIHTLRTKLAEAWTQHMSREQADQWARELIETDQCGYRLSTRPNQLHLDVVTERPLEPSFTVGKKNRINLRLGPPTPSDTSKSPPTDHIHP